MLYYIINEDKFNVDNNIFKLKTSYSLFRNFTNTNTYNKFEISMFMFSKRVLLDSSITEWQYIGQKN